MQCCACDEAKYEVTFEGLWSRHTHPKDFPSNASLVPRFSDVIGASHTTSYRFWEYGGIASEGLKQLAETGSTRMLESELKSQSQNIRTIIIAKGISYPNVTGQTYAVFRVDSRHHKISLVSMIEPSPDWIVGVSGLELCLSNCSWTESRIVNLYPWDAGTDSGITYTSPDKPTEPRDHIRRITTSFPNDPQAPFFDPTGEEMKPLARLYLTRQRLYEKSCSDVNLEFNNNEACEVEEWGMWGPCSVSCGAGKRSRQRFFKNEQRALLNGCKRALTSRETCYASFACRSFIQHKCNNFFLGINRPGQPTVDASLVDPQGDDTCATTEWSDWSGCSVKCGKGEKHRFRSMKHKRNWKECRRLDRFTKMQDSFECIGVEGPVCPEEGSAAALSVKCEYTNWSEWSPCSVTCGNGTRTRQRRVLFTKPNSYQQPQADVQSELAICQAEDRLVEHTDCQAELPSCQLTTQQAIGKRFPPFPVFRNLDSAKMENPEDNGKR
ncbi:hypothetical protein AAG570_005629 [Ranatra chinensis]|uniref:Spondin domain-containing protein n=1 Tax=Ranatra chinensis TaxID=642074 RepID=A0ABD0YGD3_9HEMI